MFDFVFDLINKNECEWQTLETSCNCTKICKKQNKTAWNRSFTIIFDKLLTKTSILSLTKNFISHISTDIKIFPWTQVIVSWCIVNIKPRRLHLWLSEWEQKNREFRTEFRCTFKMWYKAAYSFPT